MMSSPANGSEEMQRLMETMHRQIAEGIAAGGRGELVDDGAEAWVKAREA